ncbi:helix-turn-helix domain-containing protein [Mesorhizobium sp. ORM6]
MEDNLDFPLPPKSLARRLGIRCGHWSAAVFANSTRPRTSSMRSRLQAARNLLFYEEREIKDVAYACGFSYPSVFTRAFTAQFGQSPRASRQAFRETQVTVRPEIVRMSRSRLPGTESTADKVGV